MICFSILCDLCKPVISHLDITCNVARLLILESILRHLECRRCCGCLRREFYLATDAQDPHFRHSR